MTEIVETVNQELLDKRNMLTELLRHNVCNVTFTKVNGEERVMPCTLSEDIVPPAPVHITNTDNPIDFPKAKKKVNPETMSVWCLDKLEWRSFRVMNVTQIEVQVKD